MPINKDARLYLVLLKIAAIEFPLLTSLLSIVKLTTSNHFIRPRSNSFDKIISNQYQMLKFHIILTLTSISSAVTSLLIQSEISEPTFRFPSNCSGIPYAFELNG